MPGHMLQNSELEVASTIAAEDLARRPPWCTYLKGEPLDTLLLRICVSLDRSIHIHPASCSKRVGSDISSRDSFLCSDGDRWVRAHGGLEERVSSLSSRDVTIFNSLHRCFTLAALISCSSSGISEQSKNEVHGA
jgi:hypothetical protein